MKHTEELDKLSATHAYVKRDWEEGINYHVSATMYNEAMRILGCDERVEAAVPGTKYLFDVTKRFTEKLVKNLEA